MTAKPDPETVRMCAELVRSDGPRGRAAHGRRAVTDPDPTTKENHTMTKKTAKKSTKRPVLVTTAHRGVFVGETSDPADAETIALTDARMVIHWSADCRGVLGLATRGATQSCRLSPAVDRIVLRGITTVVDATAEALASWRTEPWG